MFIQFGRIWSCAREVVVCKEILTPYKPYTFAIEACEKMTMPFNTKRYLSKTDTYFWTTL